MSLYASVSCWIREIPGHLKMQEMCIEPVRMEPCTLAFVAGQYRMRWMCIEGVSRNPYTLDYVPDHFKTQDMCNDAMIQPHSYLFMITLKHKKCALRLLR